MPSNSASLRERSVGPGPRLSSACTDESFISGSTQVPQVLAPRSRCQWHHGRPVCRGHAHHPLACFSCCMSAAFDWARTLLTDAGRPATWSGLSAVFNCRRTEARSSIAKVRPQDQYPPDCQWKKAQDVRGVAESKESSKQDAETGHSRFPAHSHWPLADLSQIQLPSGPPGLGVAMFRFSWRGRSVRLSTEGCWIFLVSLATDAMRSWAQSGETACSSLPTSPGLGFRNGMMKARF